LVELALAKQSGKVLTDLIAELKESVESQEYRIKILAEAFQPHGMGVIEAMREFVAQQADWQIVPNNYEGVRVACSAPDEAGWFLLRLSLHDPVLPLNIESNVAGGVEKIGRRLRKFLKGMDELDIVALSS
jgi:phosphomannomutase